MYYTYAIVAVAKAMRMRCILHHHAVSYLTQSRRLFTRLHRLLDETDSHVVLGPEMQALLVADERVRAKVVVLSNGFMVEPDPSDSGNLGGNGSPAVSGEDGIFRVGHLCNLTYAKGIDLVIESFRRLGKTHPNVHFVLAGPVFEPRAQQELDRAREEFQDRLDYRGAVYEADKSRFFADIDVMIYPTRDDAQPLVVLEALREGKPVIATDLGCIPSMVQNHWLVRDIPAFPEAACKQIAAWVSNRQSYTDACETARAAGLDAVATSHAQMDALRKLMFSAESPS